MAMVKEPVIFQVSGYQNSGKTTLVNTLISGLKKAGASVITIKHHGHGGKPEVPVGKDASKHIESGAAASLVEGGGRLLIQAEKKDWSLEEQIGIASLLHPDIIIIEGHKQAPFPKVLLLRDADDQHLIQQLTNIQAVFYWNEEGKSLEDGGLNVPFFCIHDLEGPDYLINYLKSRLKSRPN
ncbi:molybdopterin-guanine dinucleotide biosynthesis protein B [Bacillus sp. ISL-47]|uniref:molybdopterin-guanine dinucleotide biosynthesis protein B n=1 Tax=Bacillus sp. ISL-47 TaxID=2819130 RepID=UPI001BE64807|nr:molybdopterin-guanine dinucleotide biosynthesis protein B [Bacillus sp. ISL-47]MBT2689019.1 molybdopterin-guanine dinucleotide biosynthesis protein B [Bacillus sp. ISL-47]MBT2708701.1 molybdopterin-guanine dinucleotide biosynthesis protein B [Pseudomonas sp. ISL-84]